MRAVSAFEDKTFFTVYTEALLRSPLEGIYCSKRKTGNSSKIVVRVLSNLLISSLVEIYSGKGLDPVESPNYAKKKCMA